MSPPETCRLVSWSTSMVTVFEDRADVVRVADVDLPAGACALRFSRVSPLVDEGRLIARLEGVDGHVDDAVVERRWVEDDDDPLLARRRARELERERLADERRVADDEVAQRAAARAAAETALRRWAAALARRLGRGGTLDGVDEERARLERNFRDADAALVAAEAAVARLDARLRALLVDDPRAPTIGARRACDVVVRVSSAGGRARVVLSTVVPCAAWRPAHEARLTRTSATAGEVRFVTHAAVWNRTGESWRDARIVLSTARPALGAELPSLSPDRLRLRAKTAEEKRTIVVEHRTEEVPPSATRGGAPGVDDGGQARVFAVERASIPDDGRPHMLQIGAFTAPCALARVAIPEKTDLVFLRASLKNAGRGPILAGPVTLVDDGAWVGTGDVLYTGQGDNLDLSFGSDDRLRARLTRKVHVDKKLVGRDVSHYVQSVTLSSTSTTKDEIVVLLRLPVSELQQVKVVQSPQYGTQGEVTPDPHGLVRIPVTLDGTNPHGRERTIAIAFTFETSGDVQIPAPW